MNPTTWIFGYGSLVWRPAFPYAERRPAFIAGWTRRFWQGSTDHRGVPGAPGRVVTLTALAEATCQGMAYRLGDADADETLALLDHRERGGYQRHDVELRFADDESVAGLVYVATADNPNYLGPAPLPRIAAQVRSAHGPSGANLEYVMRLADALRTMNAQDAHVFELETLLRERG